MQIRRLTHADIDASAKLAARVFGRDEAEQRGIFEQSRAANLFCRFVPPELCWGAFDASGELLARWQLIDLSMRVLDTPLRVAGALAVAAVPELRDAEVVRTLLAAGYADVDGAGFDLLLGVAQRGSIYQRLGGRPICAEPLWQLDALHVPAPHSPRFRSLQPEQVAWSIESYARANAARSGTLVRSPELLQFLPRRAPEAIAADDRSGYLGLRTAPDGIEVREVAGSTDAFFDTALRELGELARARGVRRIFGHVPHDHPLVHASAPYGATLTQDFPRHSGCMAGLVEPRRVLDKLTPALRARHAASRFAQHVLRLEIETPGCSRSLELSPSAIRGARTFNLTLALSHGALTQVIFGYLPPSVLLAAEGTPAPDAEHAAALDALFAQPAPFVWHTDRF